ncbi:MAG: glycosyltransferase family 9 protein [Verrucomicrobiota bacterium]|nr:glycosyltransferase family 9 protein [Verrucomicrobiota bacterium]
MKNFLIRQALATLRPALHPPIAERRILLISTTGLGDSLWATPSIASLRLSFPNAYIACLTSPVGLQVLEGNPHLNKLYLVQRPVSRSFFSLQRTLYQEKFDTVLIFHASDRLIFALAASLGAQTIVSTRGKNKGLDSLCTHLLPALPEEHEIDRRLRIIEETGARRATNELFFSTGSAEKFLQIEGRWVALHPGSKDSFKRWPASHFIAVGKALTERTGVNILITGSQEEEALMKEVQEGIPGARLADTRLPLHQLAALLEQVELLICNDTGPFHLACALKKRAIALYSPTNPLLCGPKTELASAIAAPPSCTPCAFRKCPYPFCLLQIGPERVIKEALSLLSKESNSYNGPGS